MRPCVDEEKDPRNDQHSDVEVPRQKEEQTPDQSENPTEQETALRALPVKAQLVRRPRDRS